MMIIEEKYKIENTNNQEEDKKDGEGEWEEVKKGGKRMKQVNTISNFKTSVLGTVFEGIIKQDIQEKGNSLSKCQIEPFFVLSLNLDGSSVDGVFQEYFSKKKIEGSSNNGSNDKYIQSFFEKLPKILVVHIKGFYYDKKTFNIVKINKPIIFKQELLIKKEFFSPSLQLENYNYELIGFIVHKGSKATEGHYICYCKDIKTNTWYYLDDKKVIQIGANYLTNIRPYVLFYKKK